MERIHRKKQKWLYQKYKADQEDKERDQNKIRVKRKEKEKPDNKEIMYRIVDLAVCSIPIIIAVIGILLLFMI